MKVTVELLSLFRQGRFTTRSMELPPQATVRAVAELLGLPTPQLGLILVNDRQSGMDQILAEGDTLTMMPLMEGG